MMRSKIVLLAVLAALGSLAPLPSQAASRTVHEDYVGNFDPLTFGRCRSGNVPVNVGKVCIPVKSTDLRVTISVKDLALPVPGFFYILKDATGTCVGEPADPLATCPNADSGCGKRANIAIPRTAVMLEIFTDGAVLGPLNCIVQEDTEGLGIAAAGTVTATFTY